MFLKILQNLQEHFFTEHLQAIASAIIQGMVGDYIREKKHFNLQSFFFLSCKMWNMFKVKNRDTRIRKVNNKVKNKDTIDVVLASLLLTLNTFHFLLQCFYCWLWSLNCWVGLLFVVMTLCACWNQFRWSFHLWKNRETLEEEWYS